MSLDRKRVRQLRENMTDAERFIWDQLRGRRLGEHKFRRQAFIEPYIVDFVCRKAKLIVELDGAHHGEPTQQDYDARRTWWLERQGFRLLRFRNEQVDTDWPAVVKAIRKALNSVG